ncbi:hypothetical protein STEG23_017405, partial [Scotinomys teguina]
MQPGQSTNSAGRTMEVVAAAPRCQLLLIMLMAAMLLRGMKGSPLLVQRMVTRTLELQESFGKEPTLCFFDSLHCSLCFYFIDFSPQFDYFLASIPPGFNLVDLSIGELSPLILMTIDCQFLLSFGGTAGIHGRLVSALLQSRTFWLARSPLRRFPGHFVMCFLDLVFSLTDKSISSTKCTYWYLPKKGFMNPDIAL